MDVSYGEEIKIWYYDENRNAFGNIVDEGSAIEIVESERFNHLIVFEATISELQQVVDIPEPEIDRNEIVYKGESLLGWTPESVIEYKSIKPPPRPKNYVELYNSRVYCMHTLYWITDTNEYVAQRGAENREGSIYFFYENDLVPEKYSGLRKLVEDTANMVEGYDREFPTDLDIDQQTMTIVDWFETNG